MFGTDLNSAFGTYDNSSDMMMAPFTPDVPSQMSRGSSEIVHKSTPLANLGQQQYGQNQNQGGEPIINLNQLNNQLQQAARQQVNQPQVQQLQLPQPSNNVASAPTGNQDPRITLLLNELKKQQAITASMQEQTGYIDRLFSKKKDMLKVLQLALVIVLAMSIHFIIDHYLRNYIKNNDFTFERELLLRLLYPFALLFVLWHMKAFIK
jgi:hypothetical protein